MNKLLLTTKTGIRVTERDLVRYFNIDRTKICYGLAESYDENLKKLTVSSQFKTKINPANIIETFSEKAWQTITFKRNNEESVSMNIYPFYGDFYLSEKKARANAIVQELPYIKHGTMSFARMQELGIDNTRDIIIATIENIINNEVMAFSMLADSSSSLNITIINNLPYKKTFSMEWSKMVQYPSTSALKNNILNRIKMIIEADILNKNGTSNTASENKVLLHPLPYKKHFTASFNDLMQYGNSDEIRNKEYRNAVQVITQELVSGSDDTSDVLVSLPFSETKQMSWNTIEKQGKEWLEQEALATIRQIIYNKIVRSYTYSNGTTIVMNLPFVFNWQMSWRDIMENGKQYAIDAAIAHAQDHIGKLANTFKYGVIVTRGKLNMVIFVLGAPILEIDDESLRQNIIENFELILARINELYDNIKTITDVNSSGMVISQVIPAVDTIEFLLVKSGYDKKVYRIFIRRNNDLYRGYVIINNRKRMKNVIFASPHIYSKNQITLKDVDIMEDPFKYNERYLSYLINTKRNKVFNLVESDKTYH